MARGVVREQREQQATDGESSVRTAGFELDMARGVVREQREQQATDGESLCQQVR